MSSTSLCLMLVCVLHPSLRAALISSPPCYLSACLLQFLNVWVASLLLVLSLVLLVVLSAQFHYLFLISFSIFSPIFEFHFLLSLHAMSSIFSIPLSAFLNFLSWPVVMHQVSWLLLELGGCTDCTLFPSEQIIEHYLHLLHIHGQIWI